MAYTYPDSDLGEVRPGRDLLPRCHVRVSVALERRFEVLQLLAGEVGALAPLTTAAAATSGTARPRQ